MGERKPLVKIKPSDNELLLAVNELADRYGLSVLTVAKVASWARMESGNTIRNNNPGNVRNKTGDDWYVHEAAVDEYINGKHVVATNENDPLRRFRSFDTLSDGIAAMLDWVKNKHTKAWQVLNNDEMTIAEFGFALGLPNNYKMRYYTADPGRYAAALKAVYDSRFVKLI